MRLERKSLVAVLVFGALLSTGTAAGLTAQTATAAQQKEKKPSKGQSASSRSFVRVIGKPAVKGRSAKVRIKLTKSAQVTFLARRAGTKYPKLVKRKLKPGKHTLEFKNLREGSKYRLAVKAVASKKISKRIAVGTVTIKKQLVNVPSPPPAVAPPAPVPAPEVELAPLSFVYAPFNTRGPRIPFFGDWRQFGPPHTWLNQYGYLSNYYPSGSVAGLDFNVSFLQKGAKYTFNNVEGAYQMGKILLSGQTLRPGDATNFQTGTADQARNLAKQYNAAHGPQIDQLMYNLVGQKFLGSSNLRSALIGTGTLKLIEGNAWGDTRWGIPFNGNHYQQGENKLGQILMGLRIRAAGTATAENIKPYVIP